MPYGLEVKNTNGAILIDGVSPNYTLLASGTAAAGVATAFPTSAKRPLIFVRHLSNNSYVRVSALSNSSFTLQMWNQPADTSVDATQIAGNIEYMVFGVASSLSPTTGYGMQLFDANGVLVFDSNRKYPRIRQVVTIPSVPIFSDSFRNPNMAIEHSQGSAPWMLANFTMNNYGYNFIQETPQQTSYLMALAIRSDTLFGNRILVQAVKTFQIGSSGSKWSYAPSQVALIQ